MKGQKKMKNQNLFKAISILLLIFIFSLKLSAQNHKTAPPTEIYYSNSGSTNDVNSLTAIEPEHNQLSPEKQGLLNQLEQARTTGNIQLKEQIEARLNEMNSSTPVQLVEAPEIKGGAVSQKSPFNNEP